MKPRRFDWYPVDWLDGTATMPPDQRGVYDTIINLIYAHGSEDGSIEIDEDELAHRCCCHWRHLRRILATLVGRGKVAQDGRKLSITRCAEEVQKSLKRIAGLAHKSPKSADTNDLDASHEEKSTHARASDKQQTASSKQQTEERDKSLSPASAALRRERDREFEEFWKLVPKKRDKEHARKAFLAARRSASFEQIIEGLHRHRLEVVGTDQQYIPFPATWLNGKRWLDEPVLALTNGNIPEPRIPSSPPSQALLDGVHKLH